MDHGREYGKKEASVDKVCVKTALSRTSRNSRGESTAIVAFKSNFPRFICACGQSVAVVYLLRASA
jgi:hypothetical protein